MKLTIENFRCHKHKIINLPDRGLVMLAGPNGCGKSTIMNAFAYVVYGKIKKPYSRDSTKTCKVTLEFDEGIKIVRTSRPNVLKVEYQNQLYEDDAGQSIIDKHILGLNEMEFSVSSYIVQKKECSILNMTPAAQAKIVENLALSDDRHEKLKAATKTLIKERETQITALRSNLDYLIPELEQKRIAMGDVPQNAEPPPRSRASVMEEYKHFVLEKRRLEGEIEEYRSRLAKEQRKERQHGVAKQTISKCEGELQMLTERLLEEFSEYNPESDTWCLSFDAPEGFDSTCISRHALIKEMDLASKKRHLFKTLKELDQSEENLNLLEENHKAQILEKICNLTRHPDFLSDEAIDKQKSQVNKAKTKDIIYRKYLDRLGRVQEAKSALKELCSEISSALSKEIEEVELESTIKSLLPHLCCPECKTKLVLPPNGELEKVKTCKGALKEDVNAKEWLEQYTSLILFTTEELNEIPNPDYQNKKERLERALKIKEQIETLKESLEDVDFIVFRRKTLERDRRVLKEELKELNFDYDPEEFLEYTRAALNQISNKEAAYKELVAKKESKAQKLEELEATIEGFDPKRMLKLETAISKAFLKVQEITTKLEILEEEKERVFFMKSTSAVLMR